MCPLRDPATPACLRGADKGLPAPVHVPPPVVCASFSDRAYPPSMNTDSRQDPTLDDEAEDSLPPPRKAFKDFAVTADSLRNCGWEQVLSEAKPTSIEYYSSPLNAAARLAEEQGDDAKEEALALLGAATSMYYARDDKDEPFKPLFIMGGTRSAALVDFEDQHLEPIKAVYQEIADSELRARLADLLWVRRRNHHAARVAASAYLESAKSLYDPENWVHGYERLRRALHIAASLGKETPQRQEAIEYAHELLTRLEGTDPKYLTSSIIQLLLDTKAGEPRSLAEFGKKAAMAAETRGDWMTAGDYWGLTATCLAKAGDPESHKLALIAQGEALVKVGEAMADSGGKGLAFEHWLERGFQVLRSAGTDKQRLHELQTRLHAAQQDTLSNMGHIQFEVPVNPQLVDHIEKARGLSTKDSIQFLALQARPLTKDALRKMVKDKLQSSPVSCMFSTNLLREDGKVDFVLPPLPMGEEPSEELMQLHMWRMADMCRQVTAMMIESVRRIVSEEHPWQDGMLDWLLKDNLFVPESRIPIFQRGLRAGLEGDYLVSTHLLVPQLENCFRRVLNQHGILTTFVKQDGTQDEHPLNTVMESEAFPQIFGEDLAFELRGLLAERAGHNLRNNTCHGLLPTGEFYGPASVAILPLTLWLLMHGVQESDEETEEQRD